jgi:hypothetical protein
MLKNRFDQSAILPAHPPRHDRKIAIDRRETGKGIDLQKIRNSVSSDADIHPGYIPAIQGAIHPQRHLFNAL